MQSILQNLLLMLFTALASRTPTLLPALHSLCIQRPWLALRQKPTSHHQTIQQRAKVTMSVLQPSSRDNVVPDVPPAKQQKTEQQALKVKRLSEHAIIPTRGSPGAAGYDLSSAYDDVVPARGKAIIKTDLSIAIPHGTYARIAPRSGLAVKHFIDTGAGVVDEDYRGPVGVVLFNHSDTDFTGNAAIQCGGCWFSRADTCYGKKHCERKPSTGTVKRGDRVAQLILERIMTPEVVEVENLDDTQRGAGGFGSTGVAAQ